MAHIHDVIMAMPDQYETKVYRGGEGERGSANRLNDFFCFCFFVCHSYLLFFDYLSYCIKYRWESEV